MSRDRESSNAALEMAEHQLRRRGIHDEKVIAAMLAVPREEFIPLADRHQAYTDAALPIRHRQTISQPYITALMAQSLALTGSEQVLEIGTGSGYHAAVLAQLARRVVTLERIPELASEARENLKRAGFGSNISVITGDGSQGYSLESPYDAISVAAAAPSVPQALLNQLNDPGALVIPVGDRDEQELLLMQKARGEITTRRLSGCRFVPLIGEGGWTS